MRCCWWSGLPAAPAPANSEIPGPIRWTCWFGCRSLEARFGASAVALGARSLDLDLLLVGGHGHSRRIRGRRLQLEAAHPRLRQRTFVAGARWRDRAQGWCSHPGNHKTAAALLQQLLAGSKETHRSSCLVALAGLKWGASLLE